MKSLLLSPVVMGHVGNQVIVNVHYHLLVMLTAHCPVLVLRITLCVVAIDAHIRHRWSMYCRLGSNQTKSNNNQFVLRLT